MSWTEFTAGGAGGVAVAGCHRIVGLDAKRWLASVNQTAISEGGKGNSDDALLLLSAGKREEDLEAVGAIAPNAIVESLMKLRLEAILPPPKQADQETWEL